MTEDSSTKEEDALRVGLPEVLRGELDEQAREALAQAAARGREAWPAVWLDDEAWIGHLASRLRAGTPLVAQIEAIDAGGLYLAAALLRLSLLDGLSIDDLAPMYAAHRATVAR